MAMHKNSSFPIDFDEDFVENIFSLRFYWGGQGQANHYIAYLSSCLQKFKTDIMAIIFGVSAYWPSKITTSSATEL